MTNEEPKDQNDASTSTASTSVAKRKEYNKQYYASRKENIKASKVCNGDVSQRESLLSSMGNTSLERIPLGTLQSNGTQMRHDTVSNSSAEKRRQRNIRYYDRRRANRNRLSNAGPSTQTPTDDQPSIRDENIGQNAYNFVYDGIPREHLILKERSPCPHCGAKRFKFEFPTFCCMNGKTKLANSEIPIELYQLFTSQDEIGEIFMKNIRAYNTNFSFASMGVTMDRTLANMRDGVYTFRAHKRIYHRVDQLQWPNLDRDITKILARVLSTNPYVKTFRRLAELGPLDNYNVTLNASVELDQRVAGIWVEGNDNITAYKRSIVVYGRSEYSQNIQPYYGCYDPLSYPLFFPNDVNRQGSRTTVAMREYYCYKFQIRSVENVLLFGGRLLQQFGVDVYIKLETSRLQFCERNQDKIRADLYQGIVDCVHAGEVRPTRVGQRIVLPASFIGGPRDMRRRFLDAMTLVQDDGKPDLFLTMTCNPQWPEIRDNLKPCQTAQDRPDLVSRVFRAKLEDLKEQLLKKISSEKLRHTFMLSSFKNVVIQIDPDEQEVVINEIKRFQDARYMVRFRDDDIMSEVVDREKNKKTMLTAFFETNRLDKMAREYLFKDFPKHFTWNAGSRRWNRRVLKPQRGRLVSANPAEGERYYLRLLLSNVKGPTSFEDLCTVNGVKYPTFRRAALEIGLIENDDC
ncbi:uncharacterized protein LOC143545295 [Bidens hawaiensis]|uniref:uncharacterized protein LOC143545295 n=1 Tax=Bidens hawaiensis TaxID=980011 RepID=UPI0040491EF6